MTDEQKKRYAASRKNAQAAWQQRHREKMKNDPVYAEAFREKNRKKQRKRYGEQKAVDGATEREQRSQKAKSQKRKEMIALGRDAREDVLPARKSLITCEDVWIEIEKGNQPPDARLNYFSPWSNYACDKLRTNKNKSKKESKKPKILPKLSELVATLATRGITIAKNIVYRDGCTITIADVDEETAQMISRVLYIRRKSMEHWHAFMARQRASG